MSYNVHNCVVECTLPSLVEVPTPTGSPLGASRLTTTPAHDQSAPCAFRTPPITGWNREPLCPTATMTKRKIQPPSTQQAGQPPTKRINVEEHTDYGGTNLIIDSLVQVISQLHMESEDDTLAHALSTILLHAPSAGMKTFPECKELITANPDLKQTLQTAINLHRYEDVMSLRRHLRDSVSFPTYNHLPASDSSKRSPTQHFVSSSIGG